MGSGNGGFVDAACDGGGWCVGGDCFIQRVWLLLFLWW